MIRPGGLVAWVRTILGDIEPEALGVCYAHEHLIIDRSFPTDRYPDFLLNDQDKAVAELTTFRNDGGQAMVDSMPCDCGRNVRLMAEVSRQTGVHLLIPTGLHLPQYYDSGHWGGIYDVDELTELFVADIREGIDERDYNGPLVKRTPHRAGLIKVATGETWTDRERRAFEAAAAAHRQTGAPILTHTEQGALALDQVEVFEAGGVDLKHVVLSHLDRRPDLAYHREILATGVKVEYDSAFRWSGGKANPTLDLVLALIEPFPDQLMLGMDAARRRYWKAYGGSPGLSFLLNEFSTMLTQAGLHEDQLTQIFIQNPREAYAFAGQTP